MWHATRNKGEGTLFVVDQVHVNSQKGRGKLVYAFVYCQLLLLLLLLLLPQLFAQIVKTLIKQ